MHWLTNTGHTLGAPGGPRRVKLDTRALEDLLIHAWAVTLTGGTWGSMGLILTAWADALATAGLPRTDDLLADLDWLTDICHTQEQIADDRARASAMTWEEFRAARVANA
jgi:hypothetical protein